MRPFWRAAAWLIVQLRFVVVVVWIAATAGAVVYLPSLRDAGTETSLLGLVPSEAESIEAGARLAELFRVPVITHTHVVQRNPDGLSRAALRRVARRAQRIVERQDPELRGILFALPIVNVRGLVPSSRENGTTAITYLFFDPAAADVYDQAELADRFAEKYVRFQDDALVGVTGAVPARIEEWRRIESGLPWVTLATIVLIAVILGVHFRSAVAPLVALLAAGTAYIVAQRVAAWAGEAFGVGVPRDIEPVLVVLVLGVVTDYAVFFLHGMRERLDAGERRVEAAYRATAEYLPIVVTAGLIVAGGTAALVAGELEFFRAFGPGMAVTVVVSLVVAVTLVPALMAIVGSVGFGRRGRAAERAMGRPSRLAVAATARPVALAVTVVSLAVLAVASRGLVDTNLGMTQLQGLPGGAEARLAYDAAARGFAPGILSPTVVLLEGVDTRRDLRALVRLQRALQDEAGVAAAIGPAGRAAREIPGLVLSPEAQAARFLLVLDREPQGGPAVAIVERLRDRLPGLLDEAGLGGARVRLAGDTALAEETVDTIMRDLLRIGVAAFLVNFLLLAIFLRAVVAPLYLLLASGLALAASLGLTTLVFQGFLDHGELTYYVPFAVAVLLLSLGSDYNVFVVGRIWQRAEREPIRKAIATAAPRASRAIGTAGLALAFSFAALVLIDLRQFREFAFAMFVGVLLDAFVIRALLIPALVSLVGERSWWPRRGPRPAEERA